MLHPNIFNHATKELSQDAFILWLLEWADDKYETEPEHLVAKEFLKALFDKSKFALPVEVHTKVQKQFKDIDILCEVNDEYMILIEDKVNSGAHSNQLQRYKETIEEYYPNHKLILIYLKTGIKVDVKHAEKNEYSVFSREDFLKVLEKNNSDNAILCNYHDYLINIENQYYRFEEKKLEEWDDYTWTGFIEALSKSLIDSKWDKYFKGEDTQYIHFNWNYIEDGDVAYDPHLEIKNKKLCFKAQYAPYGDNQDYRKKCSEHLRTILIPVLKQHNIEVSTYNIKPSTVNSQTTFYINDFVKSIQGYPSIDSTLIFIKQVITIMNETINSYKNL